jgi:hypothetical protein
MSTNYLIQNFKAQIFYTQKINYDSKPNNSTHLTIKKNWSKIIISQKKGNVNNFTSENFTSPRGGKYSIFLKNCSKNSVEKNYKSYFVWKSGKLTVKDRSDRKGLLLFIIKVKYDIELIKL